MPVDQRRIYLGKRTPPSSRKEAQSLLRASGALAPLLRVGPGRGVRGYGAGWEELRGGCTGGIRGHTLRLEEKTPEGWGVAVRAARGVGGAAAGRGGALREGGAGTLPCTRIQRQYKACLHRRDARPSSSFPVVALMTSMAASPTVQLTLKLGAFPGCRASALLMPGAERHG